MLDEKTQVAIKNLMVEALPEVEAIYLFGSVATATDHVDSDVDLGFLMALKPKPDAIFYLKSSLSALLRKDVDLVDMRRADTVTIAQILATGKTLFAKDLNLVAHFETTAMSQYALLNEERREILQDIVNRGSIYG